MSAVGIRQPLVGSQDVPHWRAPVPRPRAARGCEPTTRPASACADRAQHGGKSLTSTLKALTAVSVLALVGCQSGNSLDTSSGADKSRGVGRRMPERVGRALCSGPASREHRQRRRYTLERERRAPRTRFGLLPAVGHENRPTWLLEKASFRRGASGHCRFWEAVRKHRLLSRHGGGHALDVAAIRLTDGSKAPLWRCTTCGARTTRNAGDVCTAWRCQGTLEPLDGDDRQIFERTNHYVRRYVEEPMAAVAREHTAAIGTSRREKIEERSREGRIHL